MQFNHILLIFIAIAVVSLSSQRILTVVTTLITTLPTIFIVTALISTIGRTFIHQAVRKVYQHFARSRQFTWSPKEQERWRVTTFQYPIDPRNPYTGFIIVCPVFETLKGRYASAVWMRVHPTEGISYFAPPDERVKEWYRHRHNFSAQWRRKPILVDEATLDRPKKVPKCEHPSSPHPLIPNSTLVFPLASARRAPTPSTITTDACCLTFRPPQNGEKYSLTEGSRKNRTFLRSSTPSRSVPPIIPAFGLYPRGSLADAPIAHGIPVPPPHNAENHVSRHISSATDDPSASNCATTIHNLAAFANPISCQETEKSHEALSAAHKTPELQQRMQQYPQVRSPTSLAHEFTTPAPLPHFPMSSEDKVLYDVEPMLFHYKNELKTRLLFGQPITETQSNWLHSPTRVLPLPPRDFHIDKSQYIEIRPTPCPILARSTSPFSSSSSSSSGSDGDEDDNDEASSVTSISLSPEIGPQFDSPAEALSPLMLSLNLDPSPVTVNEDIAMSDEEESRDVEMEEASDQMDVEDSILATCNETPIAEEEMQVSSPPMLPATLALPVPVFPITIPISLSSGVAPQGTIATPDDAHSIPIDKPIKPLRKSSLAARALQNPVFGPLSLSSPQESTSPATSYTQLPQTPSISSSHSVQERLALTEMHVDHATSLMTQADSTPRRPTSSVAASSGNIDLSGSRSKEAKFVAIGKAPYKPVKRSPLAQSWVIEPVDSESNDERAPGSSSSTANPSPVPTAGTSNITRKVESGSNVVAINGITIPAEALARFKVKVSLRKGSHSRISEEFLRDVVLVALKDCNIEGAVRQMAAFDPSLGPAEKSQRLWQLRWVVDKWGLHPDASASTKAILGPEGEGRKVAGSRRLQAYLAAQDRKE